MRNIGSSFAFGSHTVNTIQTVNMIIFEAYLYIVRVYNILIDESTAAAWHARNAHSDDETSKSIYNIIIMTFKSNNRALAD